MDNYLADLMLLQRKLQGPWLEAPRLLESVGISYS
jgi:hypothetical protein